jgi:AcrR family transcriptional regulator
MATFQRARSAKQREVRRAAILATATQMLTEMPSAAISLNELSRRARMAKSNVLRYFESREAVLLEICNAETDSWVSALVDTLDAGLDPSASVGHRVDRLIDAVVDSLANRPVLCDLISTQASALEHNVSVTAVLEFKRLNIASIERLAGGMLRCVPELGADGVARFTALAAMLTSSVWTHANPPAAVQAAYDADPALAAYRTKFAPMLHESLHTVAAGLLAVSGGDRSRS